MGLFSFLFRRAPTETSTAPNIVIAGEIFVPDETKIVAADAIDALQLTGAPSNIQSGSTNLDDTFCIIEYCEIGRAHV